VIKQLKTENGRTKKMKFKLKNVRLAFADIFAAKAFQGSPDARFGASLLIDPKDPQVKDLKKAMKELAIEKWGKKGSEIFEQLYSKEKTCLRDGNDDSCIKYDGFEDMFYIKASSKVKPTILDRDGVTRLEEIDGKPYSGCHVYATIDLWCQDNSFGKRINAQLTGVQFFKDGDSFSGGRPASLEDFEDLSDGTEDEDEDEEDLV